MKPKHPENQESQLELLRPRLECFINMKHPLVRLGQRMRWEEFDAEFGNQFGDRGRPALPTRLMVALTYLKYLWDLSDEEMVERFIADPYVQHFCGFEYFQHEAPCDSSSLTRWRKRLGEAGAEKLLTETLAVAHELGLITLKQCTRVIVDTTVQVKDITYPTDSKLINKSREKLVKMAKERNIPLRQTYTFKGKHEAHRCSRLLHARQFNRAKTSIKKQKTMLGRVIRDIVRKTESPDDKLVKALVQAEHIYHQDRNSPEKIYSLHEPQVECISKGKARTPYEFGNKVSFAITARNPWVLGVKSFFANPYDGATLKPAVEQVERLTGVTVEEIFVDKGYRGKSHHPEGKTVLLSGRTRLTPRLKALLRRRSSIEPIIGHSKHDHRLERNLLRGQLGDEMNPILAGAAFNLRKLLRGFFLRLLAGLLEMQKEPGNPALLPT